MLSCRNLAESDCEFIMQNWVGHSVIFRGNMSRDELLVMLKEMATKEYSGKYNEWFVMTMSAERARARADWRKHELKLGHLRPLHSSGTDATLSATRGANGNSPMSPVLLVKIHAQTSAIISAISGSPRNRSRCERSRSRRVRHK